MTKTLNLIKLLKIQSPAYASIAAAVIVIVILAFYHTDIDEPSRASFSGTFKCAGFEAGIGPDELKKYSGSGRFETLTLFKTDSDPGVYTSSLFSVAMAPRSQASFSEDNLKLFSGAVEINYFIRSPKPSFTILTPNSRMNIHGTRLAVNYDGRATFIKVFEGVVGVMKKDGELILTAGEAASIIGETQPVKAPRTVVIPAFEKTYKPENLPAATSEIRIVENGNSTVEIVSGATSEIKTGPDKSKAPGEKLLEYEIDYDSMDDKTKKLFFKGK